MKENNKNWLIALVSNPITTIIIIYMIMNNFNILNVIGIAIIGYGIFAYFLFNAIKNDRAAAKARKAKMGKNKKKKKR